MLIFEFIFVDSGNENEVKRLLIDDDTSLNATDENENSENGKN